MSKFIGRRIDIGIAKETTRGTFVTSAYFLPKQELSIDEKVTSIDNETAVGRIEDTTSSDIVEKYMAGSIGGRIADLSFGEFLLGVTGTEASPATVETGVYDHVFTVLNTAQHPSFSLSVQEPNATGASALRYTLVALEELEIMLELKKYAMYKASFRGNTAVTGTTTPSYSVENIFLPQNASFKYASAQSGLDAATAVQIKKFSLKINKNLEDDFVLGSVAAVDRLNKQYSIEGTVELMYEDRTFIDTIMIGDLAKALRFKFANTAITIGATSNPTLTIDLYAAKIKEVARKMDNNGLVTQTLSFKAHYSITDSGMIVATVRNTRSSAY